MIGFDDTWLASRMMFLIPLLLSLAIHEWAHAWSASLLGDDTAERLGRLTLNPLAHIDPIGTLVLPLLGVPFGWAKPVPFNPIRFRRSVSLRMGTLIVASAGPLSNLCLALLSVILLALVVSLQPISVGVSSALQSLLEILILLNVILAVFNAIPVPPLDGSHVANSLMPEALRPLWDRFCQLGYFSLLAVIIIPLLFGVSIFQWPLEITGELINAVLTLAQ